jgi:hypothetical protein
LLSRNDAAAGMSENGGQAVFAPYGLRVILKKTKPLDQRSHARAQECARKAAHRSVYVRWVALGRAVMDLAVWLWSLGLERYEVVFREG